jgi:hypothetical protein
MKNKLKKIEEALSADAWKNDMIGDAEQVLFKKEMEKVRQTIREIITIVDKIREKTVYMESLASLTELKEVLQTLLNEK